VIDFTKDFIAGDDGYYMYWPTTNLGAYTAHNLRIIADELDRKNKPWDDQVQAYFSEPKL
jgi:hypothetical protein